MKEPLAPADWMFHPDTNHRLMVLYQDNHARGNWERYGPNQPGLYFHPTSRMFYRVKVENGKRTVYQIPLKDVITLLDAQDFNH